MKRYDDRKNRRREKELEKLHQYDDPISDFYEDEYEEAKEMR